MVRPPEVGRIPLTEAKNLPPDGLEQVRELAARTSGARHRELRSTNGHNAFLVEWAQMGVILREALADCR